MFDEIALTVNTLLETSITSLLLNPTIWLIFTYHMLFAPRCECNKKVD
jgi:hypothetical protein